MTTLLATVTRCCANCFKTTNRNGGGAYTCPRDIFIPYITWLITSCIPSCAHFCTFVAPCPAVFFKKESRKCISAIPILSITISFHTIINDFISFRPLKKLKKNQENKKGKNDSRTQVENDRYDLLQTCLFG